MSNCISYSIFGYNNEYQNSFPFRTYLRGLGINIRAARLLYPEWLVYINVDRSTFESEYKKIFHQWVAKANVYVDIFEDQPLCRGMLQRLKPIFTGSKYERVLCRDTDSLLQYRERQAVAYWQSTDRVAHAITDSVSHNVELMGGMIGLKCGDIRMLTATNTLDELIAIGGAIDYNRKGSDQDFLNRVILPRVSESITEHYIKGLPNSFRADYHNTIEEFIPLDPALKETDNLGWHIGASGFQVDATVQWLNKMDGGIYDDIEKQFPEVFYWHLK